MKDRTYGIITIFIIFSIFGLAYKNYKDQERKNKKIIDTLFCYHFAKNRNLDTKWMEDCIKRLDKEE